MCVSREKMTFVLFGVLLGVLALGAGSAQAESSYLNSFNSQYGTSGTVLDSCSLCHPSVPRLNGYGDDYANGRNFINIQSLDSDGDGFVNLDEINSLTSPGDASSFPETLPTCTDNDGDGFALEGGNCGAVDCNDSSRAVNPSAQESCIDSIDNNCNGLIDNQDPQAVGCPPVCTDIDGDGYAIEGGDCGQVDCNDRSRLVNPGATENCSDNQDNDCDGLVDAIDPDAVNCPIEPPPAPTCTDNDLDGFAVEGGDCGLVDCNDSDPAINLDAIESCTDGFDNNCNGLTDIADPNAVACPANCSDLDLDGYAVEGGECGPVDCNDEDEFINPSAAEECTDGIDNDCNDLIDIADPNVVNCPGECVDSDGDGYAVDGDACGQVDCSDNDSSVNPGSTEICGDGIDQDCSGGDLPCATILSPPNVSLVVSGVNVTVNWTKIADATGYKLSYAPYPYRGPKSIVALDVGDVTSVSYELWEGAAYNVAVQAYNGEGSSGYSNIEYFLVASFSDDDDGDEGEDEDKGEDDAEEAADNDQVPSHPRISLQVAGTNVSISWAAVDGAEGYTLSYAPYPYAGPESIGEIDLGNVTTVSYDLQEGSAFNIALQAYNDKGKGAYSNTEYFVVESSVAENSDPSEKSDEDPVEVDTDGAMLYANNCGSCHGSLSSSNILETSPAAISTAIAMNAGGMGSLQSLSSAQVSAISVALTDVAGNSAPPVEEPVQGSTDGVMLYANNCGSCHGPLNRSNISGRSPAAISTAIAMNAGGMGSLQSLSSAQVSAISVALTDVAGNSAPPVEEPVQGSTDGAMLYANNCGSCHGSLSSSNVDGRSPSAINTAISLNAGGMGSLQSLSTTQVNAIASSLANVPNNSAPPAVDSTDGATLYANNCARCHGSLNRSDVGGEDADDIEEAIEENEGGMGMLGFLDSSQVRAIANVLEILDHDSDDDD